MNASTFSRRRKLLALVAVSLVTSACGFKLRGNVAMPFTSIWTSFGEGSSLGGELKRALTSNPNLRVLPTREAAQVALIILGETREKLVLGLSSAGAVREYQLVLKLRYEVLGLKGRELSKPLDILLKRDVTSSDAQIVSKEREDELLYREMQSDMVQQLLRRLAALPPQ
jgi:LPS-assembly lipoprotein